MFCCPWFHFHGDEPHFYHPRLGNHREELWSESLAKPTPDPKRPGGSNQGDRSVPEKQWCLLLFILTHPGDTIITSPSLWRSVGRHPFGAVAMQSNLEQLRGGFVNSPSKMQAFKTEPLNKLPSFAGSYGSSIIFLAFVFSLPGDIVPSPTIACLGKSTWGLVWVFFAQDYRAASQQGLLWLFPHSPLPPSPPLLWKEFQAGFFSLVIVPNGALMSQQL